jgi:hypothetical protein
MNQSIDTEAVITMGVIVGGTTVVNNKTNHSEVEVAQGDGEEPSS